LNDDQPGARPGCLLFSLASAGEKPKADHGKQPRSQFRITRV
jgi:hypothetical protein